MSGEECSSHDSQTHSPRCQQVSYKVCHSVSSSSDQCHSPLLCHALCLPCLLFPIPHLQSTANQLLVSLYTGAGCVWYSSGKHPAQEELSTGLSAFSNAYWMGTADHWIQVSMLPKTFVCVQKGHKSIVNLLMTCGHIATILTGLGIEISNVEKPWGS